MCTPTIQTVAIIGAGNGGKTAAADLALRGLEVRLAEFPEFGSNLDDLRETLVLRVEGAVEGQARLARVTTDIAAAVTGADLIMACCQARAHERLARVLAPLVRPEQIVVLNPGSTGGTLHLARVFREMGMDPLPLLVEFGTLTYGCRARDSRVHCAVKVGRVACGTFPGKALESIFPTLQEWFPGLVRARHVLHAGLTNANPVIHPPIALMNGARFENEGDKVLFYRDGVSPSVARLIELLDGERMALLEALDCPAQPDPVTSVQQGYADSTEYLSCYRDGHGFASFGAPSTLDHRYLHEDVGMGLVLYCTLGRQLGVPTPAAEAVVAFAEQIAGIPYMAEARRTPETLGIAGLTPERLGEYLETSNGA